MSAKAKKLAILVVSRNRPDLVESLVARLENSTQVAHDLFVIECGTDADKLSPRTSLWYPDPDFRGKCFGHAAGLQFAKLRGQYEYFWFLMNDLVFEDGSDPARTLIETLEANERMGILSPTNVEGGYPAATPRANSDFRVVTTCDYLGFMMKASALEECGFLNPDFKYCWGAIHELSFELYSRGWFVAYSDRTSYRHLGGTTYGAQGTNTISREEYQRLAKRFAFDYFRETYGTDWDERFWREAERFAPEVNSYREHRELWSRAFDAQELEERARSPQLRIASLVPPTDPNSVRLHLGCGPEKRAGWINIDSQAAVHPDIVTAVDRLSMFEDASVDAIEANHLFEHLTLGEARRALTEWARVLKPRGELHLEMPDLESCLRILGKYEDERGFDLGLIGIFGWPPAIEAQGIAQVHKWGWTRATLREELHRAGFGAVDFGPITQHWRAAAKVGRDLRVRAERIAAALPSPDAFPIATEKPTRIFAWPNWTDPAELEQLLREFASSFGDRTDTSLVLRHDPKLDGPAREALAALEDAYREALGPEQSLDVVLLDDELGTNDWPRLARALTTCIELPSSTSEPRKSLLAALPRASKPTTFAAR